MKKIINKINKKVFFCILIVLCVVIGTTIFLVLRKEKNVNDISVSEIDVVKPLEKADEAIAAKLIKNNIVKIINKVDNETTITGTGFFIEKGYLVTNSHIVDIMGDILIEYNDGFQEKAYLYSNSINYDIALLKSENVKVKSLSFGDTTNLEVTNDVLSAGYIYNFSGEASVSKGILSARRENQGITYLQSDISIDSGSSGGPLFDSKANVLGINTFVTQNRTFSISISSESANTIIQSLLYSPNIEYLTETRPSNSINEVLVEIGYTTDKNFNLYNDIEIVKKSNKKHGKEIKEYKNENKNKDNEEIDECPEEYLQRIGKNCITEKRYNATITYGECKEGYTKTNDTCTKTYTTEAKPSYYCPGKLTEKNTCIEIGRQIGNGSYETRWGSCPKGKKCYDMGRNPNKKFISELVCPANSQKVSTGIKFVWNGEEITEANIKKWNTKESGAIIAHDKDGIEYYEDTNTILSMCAKSYDSTNDVYVLYTYDDLKNTACSNGGKFISHYNNQGFYCLLSKDIHMYAWDPVCYDTTYTWMTDGYTYFCGRNIEQEYIVEPNYICETGDPQPDGKTCLVTDIYTLPPIYTCDENDTLYGQICGHTIIVPLESIKKQNT